MEFFIFLILFIGFLILLYTVVKALNEHRIQSKAEQILDGWRKAYTPRPRYPYTET